MDNLLSMFSDSAKTFVAAPDAQSLPPAGSPSAPAKEAVDNLFHPLKMALSSMEDQVRRRHTPFEACGTLAGEAP